MKNLDQIIGQQGVVRHLENALSDGKISQAYLITGEEGMGKKTIARAFAAALLCEDRKQGSYLSCGRCRSCHQIETDNHPDLKVIAHEKPQIISVDEIRSQVVSDVDIRPYQNGRKVYIIPDAQLMNEQAQNALLKTLEEPPDYAVIILLSTNENMMLSTIKSRCIRLPLSPLPEETIKEALRTDYHIPDYRADQIVRFARGNLGKSVEMAQEDDFLNDLHKAGEMMSQVVRRPSYEWSEYIELLTEDKSRYDFYLGLFIDYYRDILLLKAGGDPRRLMFFDEEDTIREEAGGYGFPGLLECEQALFLAQKRLKENVKPELVFFELFQALSDNYER